MEQATPKATPWDGGIKRGGRWVIREQVDGRRWTITLRVRSEEEAKAELALFRRDPALYAREVERRRTEGAAQAVRLDDATLLAFLRSKRDDEERSEGYCHDLKRYLEGWQERIGTIDLRCKGLSLARVKDALRGGKAVPQRAAALKVFLGWLRQEGKIEMADDPTANGALRVESSKPAKRADKGDVPREHIEAVLAKLAEGRADSAFHDMLLLQAGTGWHTSEVFRFMRGGSFAPLPSGKKPTKDEAGVIVCPERKSGEEERKRVSAEVLTAAKRLRLRGWSFKKEDGTPRKDRNVRDSYDQALARACKSAKVPIFSGAQMRHTNATALINEGIDPAHVASWLGHRDKRTTLRFYARHGVVAKPSKGVLF